MTALWPYLLCSLAWLALIFVLSGHRRLFRDPPGWRSGGLSMTVRNGRARIKTAPKETQ